MESEILLLIIGVVGLWFGSDIAINFGKKISEALKVSTLIIGLTVTSIGTSLGEIVTSIVAAYDRLQGIQTSSLALGTIIGSNISLITFVLGFCGFFTIYYLGRKKDSMRRDWNMLFFAIILMFLFSFNDKKIDLIEAIIMLLVYITYVFVLLKQEKLFKKISTNHDKISLRTLFFYGLMIFAGIVIVIYSANVIINNAILIATKFKMNSGLIGILIGFGTSLPELTISLHSIFKGAHGLSIGNLIGAGITDSLMSLGIGAIIAPLVVDNILLFFDIPFMFVSVLIAWLFFIRGGKLDRLEASLLILLYFVFIWMKFFILPNGF
ncbi:sodium:calcium antiporter [Candidatus Woesearchaeota archaeon]|nr:sodium:calcium antiporter [Candidatus Woesearchaeota archaeon]